MATVPSFRTWVVGELVTASFMNTNIRDAGNFFTADPCAEMRQAVAQSIPNSANTAILLDTEDLDSDNGHSTVTNTSRYTAQTAGWWRVMGGVSLTGNATGTRNLFIAKNSGAVAGTGTNNGVPGAASWAGATKSKLVSLIVGDFVEVFFFQNSGGALNTLVSGVEIQAAMSVQWVRV